MSDERTSPTPQVLQAFGVAGLLRSEATIFYDTLFSSRHLGRVSDLLVGRIKQIELDEVRLRSMLMYGFFEAYLHSQTGKEIGGTLSEPIVVECGMDGERIVAGFSFTAHAESIPDLDDLRGRIQDKADDPFARLMGKLIQQVDGIVVRVHAEIRRYEVVTWIDLGTQAGATEPYFEIAQIDPRASAPPQTASYVQLGDVDYHRILADDSPLRKPLTPSSTGEVLARATLAGAVEATRVTGALPADDATEILIKGTAPAADMTTTLVKGRVAGVDTTETRFKDEDADDVAHQVIKGRRVASDESSTLFEADAFPAPMGKTESPETGFRGMLKKVWPFKKSASPAESVDTAAAEESADLKDLLEPDEAEEPIPEVVALPVMGSASLDVTTNNFLNEVQAGMLTQTIDKIQVESKELAKDPAGARAKSWMDGMMSEVLAERARLTELAKKVGVTIRQKELETRQREQVLDEHIKRQDRVLRQKENSLTRLKEQLGRTGAELGRLRAHASGTSEENALRQKLIHAQTGGSLLKEENTQLKAKIEELRAQAGSAQAHANAQAQALGADPKRAAAATGELQTVQAKLARAQRMIDDLKRGNQQLTDKVAEAKKEAGDDTAELKKKLEAAMKILSANKKAYDKMNVQYERIKKDEVRIKMELQVAQSELKSLKESKTPGGRKPAGDSSDSSGSSSSAAA